LLTLHNTGTYPATNSRKPEVSRRGHERPADRLAPRQDQPDPAVDGKDRQRGDAEPKGKYKSLVAVFEEALEQEVETSADIDKLYELAQKEKAFAALVQLQWFISEQVEEEKTAREIVAKFQHTQNDPAAIMDLDRELAARVPEKPASGAP
jgi:hypothetical protein